GHRRRTSRTGTRRSAGRSPRPRQPRKTDHALAGRHPPGSALVVPLCVLVFCAFCLEAPHNSRSSRLTYVLGDLPYPARENSWTSLLCSHGNQERTPERVRTRSPMRRGAAGVARKRGLRWGIKKNGAPLRDAPRCKANRLAGLAFARAAHWIETRSISGGA